MLSLVATVGENLKRLRGLMRQEALAEAAGVAQGDISKWEKDKAVPTIPSLLKLAKGLNRPVDELLAGLDAEYDRLVSDLLRHADRGSSSAAHSQPQQGDIDVTGDAQARRALAKELTELSEDFHRAVQDVANRLSRGMASPPPRRPAPAHRGGKAGHVRGVRKVG
jgi:transcriptional regulator with XRE-family HTH domain